MSKQKRPSTRATSARTPKHPVVVRPAVPDTAARFRRESDMIGSALEPLPALDRAAQAREVFPYHAVASSAAMQRMMLRIVRRRLPASRWADACAALVRTDDNGTGFAEFLDAVRDVAFMAGVEYARRSWPGWWPLVQKLEPSEQEAIGAIVRGTALCLGVKDSE